MDIKPSEVMDCLRDAGVQNWYLMGLHGYVGYLPMPRATQDVDVMVPHNQKRKAIQAISERWPELVEEEFEPVVRFYDPGELDRDGNKVPVIDLMLPWSRFQETPISGPPKNRLRISSFIAGFADKIDGNVHFAVF